MAVPNVTRNSLVNLEIETMVGFNTIEWEQRTTEQLREQMVEIAHENERLESLYGTRYSVLGELPYFDIVRMSIVDPMHNLFLGTAKKMLLIWKELGYLSKPTLEKLQEKTDSFIVPCDVGKVLQKTISRFDG